MSLSFGCLGCGGLYCFLFALLFNGIGQTFLKLRALLKPPLDFIKRQWAPLRLDDIIARIYIVMVDRVSERGHHRAGKTPAEAARHHTAERPNIIRLHLSHPRLIADARDNIIVFVEMEDLVDCFPFLFKIVAIALDIGN